MELAKHGGAFLRPAIDDKHQRPDATRLFLVGVIPFLVLMAAHWRYAPLAQFGDWAQYLLHADAVLNGRSYSDIGYLFTDLNPFIGPRVQPPGLPAFLVPLVALAGGARMSILYKLLMVAFTLGFLGGVAVYFSRNGIRLLAVAPVLVLGVWLESAFITNTVQPDAAFCAFVWAIFCLTDRTDAWTSRRVVAVTVLGLLALAFRLAALPLIPALGVFALAHRRQLGFKPFVPLLVWLGCGLVAAIAAPETLTFGRIVIANLGKISGAIIESAKFYPFGALEPFLYPFPWNHVNDLYHVIAGVLMLIGLASWIRGRATSMLTLFAVFTVAMLLVLPMQDPRYLMPLAPLSIYAAALGGSIAIAWLAVKLRRPLLPIGVHQAAVAVVAILVVCALGRELMRPRPMAITEVPGIKTLFDSLTAANERSRIRVVFMNPRVLTWETGIPAMGFFSSSADTTMAEFREKRINLVVVGDVDTDPRGAAAIEAAVAERREAFRRLYTTGVFTTYEFDSTRLQRP